MSKLCKSCQYNNINKALYCASCGCELNNEVISQYSLSQKIGTVFIVIGMLYGLFNYSEKEETYREYVSSTSSNHVYEDNEYLDLLSQKNDESPKINKYSLSINATPSDSKIEIVNINEAYIKNMKIKKGKYHLRVSKEGYETFDKWILLKDDFTVTAKLKRNKFILKINANPSDSKIEILNIHQLYVKNMKLKKGEYHIRVSKEGYEALDKWILLEDYFYMRAKLKRSEIILNVNPTPSDSKIEILNINQAYTKDMKLKKGKYHIRVSKEGYKTFDKWISLEDNSYITANLVKNVAWECQVEYVIQKNKKYIHPTNENLQKLTIELTNDMDKLHLQSQNGKSVYDYNSFIDLDNGDLGIDYILDNRFIDIFQNGSIIMGNITNGIDRKYFCKDMTLDIKRVEGNKYSATFINNNHNVIEPKVKKTTNIIEKFSLNINIIPKSSRIKILNIKQKYHDGIKLKKGKYHIQVSKEGYVSGDSWIELREDRKINITLKKIEIRKTIENFSFTINTTPSNAKIRILNIKPKYYDGIKLKRGKYHIEVSKRGYSKVDKWVSLNANRTIGVELIKNTIYEKIESLIPIHIDSLHIPISPKKIKNYNKCLTGRTPILCEHSWLTPEQTIKVRKAERRENYSKCLTGRSPILCEHSWLTPQQLIEVKRAENR